MKILYISTVFPQQKDNSTMYTDLAEALVLNGHRVTVVATEEKKKSIGSRITFERGCTVLRVKIGNMYNVGVVEKGWTIITLQRSLKKAIRKYIPNEIFDIILFEAPPVTLSEVIKTAKKMYQSPAFLMMKDIFPQNAVDIGIIKENSVIHYYFAKKEKELYRVADNIGCMSQGNKKYLLEHGNVPESKLSIFPNTKKISLKIEKSLDIREKYNIPKDKVVFLFGGNMGKPQGMEFLANAILKAELVEKAYFILIGRGTEKDKVRNILRNSRNVLILEEIPRHAYESIVASCDVGIVSLDYRFSIPNYPSRILSYMEVEKPVLAATDPNTDFKNLIQNAKCGLWCCSNDYNKFIEAVTVLCENESLRNTMGKNGRCYLEEHFDVQESVKLLENYYLQICNRKTEN